MIRSHSQNNKTTDLPNGVSRFEEVDKRSPNPKIKVGFGALVYVNGKAKIKKFRVSEKASEKSARDFAIKFRTYYEHCALNGIEFDYEYLSDWQKI